jgi:predicted NUDIX family phosphoesterase
MAGVEREIEEELNISGKHTQRIVAVLNDDSNDVGKVHLGVVHLFELESDNVTANEDSIADLKFSTIAELQGEMRDSLESWSQFCADILDQV